MKRGFTYDTFGARCSDIHKGLTLGEVEASFGVDSAGRLPSVVSQNIFALKTTYKCVIF